VDLEEFPKSFYFGKNRDRQLRRGFNSSISSVFDDFNWRFSKGVRSEEIAEGEQNFFEKKNAFEKEIVGKIDETSVKKSFESLNNKLKEFGVGTIDISFIDSSAPFDTAFLTQKLEKLDLSITALGSGIEMITALLFFRNFGFTFQRKNHYFN